MKHLKHILPFTLILLFFAFETSVFSASVLTVSRGKYADRVKVDAAKPATILRAESKKGPYTVLSFSENGKYEDRTAVPGMKYWYAAVPGKKYNSGQQVAKLSGAVPAWGYAVVKRPRGMNFNKVVNSRNQPKPSNVTAQDRRYLKFLEPYYMNYFKLNLILWLAKPYINSGKLIVLEGFESYTIYRSTKKIIMFGPDNKWAVLFQPGKMFRMMKKVPDAALYDKLIKNGVAFCRYSGQSEVITKDGKRRILPLFEAYGMPTHYFPKYKGWKSNTIIFGTSNKQMKEELLDAEKKGR